MPHACIHIQSASQNNLKNLTLRLPLHELIVITGVSGSGKSSLAFDTIYAEGQRRYVETFSPYARQFLERMDKPRVERIEGIPPAIAIDQVNPVRGSRSTVGTMTELNDHLKLLFARVAALYCRGCGRRVERDTPESIADALLAHGAGELRAVVTFPVTAPAHFDMAEVTELLARQGYTRLHSRNGPLLEVIQDRPRLSPANRARLVESLEAALSHGRGRVAVYPLDEQRQPGAPWRFSAHLHCPDCDLRYPDPQPGLFSFNSPAGACPTCRGFGRTMGIDVGLVNVLIALLDADHIHHHMATAWLSTNIHQGWASCPLTQNGCIRIMAQPGYPHALAPVQVARRLAEATGTEYHAFWADDLSLLETGMVQWESVLGPRQVTDVYLLALAVHQGGRFVTFDRAIPRRAVTEAKADHLVVL